MIQIRQINNGWIIALDRNGEVFLSTIEAVGEFVGSVGEKAIGQLEWFEVKMAADLAELNSRKPAGVQSASHIDFGQPSPTAHMKTESEL